MGRGLIAVVNCVCLGIEYTHSDLRTNYVSSGCVPFFGDLLLLLLFLLLLIAGELPSV